MEVSGQKVEGIRGAHYGSLYSHKYFWMKKVGGLLKSHTNQGTNISGLIKLSHLSTPADTHIALQLAMSDDVIKFRQDLSSSELEAESLLP